MGAGHRRPGQALRLVFGAGEELMSKPSIGKLPPGERSRPLPPEELEREFDKLAAELSAQREARPTGRTGQGRADADPVEPAGDQDGYGSRSVFASGPRGDDEREVSDLNNKRSPSLRRSGATFAPAHPL